MKMRSLRLGLRAEENREHDSYMTVHETVQTTIIVFNLPLDELQVRCIRGCDRDLGCCQVTTNGA